MSCTSIPDPTSTISIDQAHGRAAKQAERLISDVAGRLEEGMEKQDRKIRAHCGERKEFEKRFERGWAASFRTTRG